MAEKNFSIQYAVSGKTYGSLAARRRSCSSVIPRWVCSERPLCQQNNHQRKAEGSLSFEKFKFSQETKKAYHMILCAQQYRASICMHGQYRELQTLDVVRTIRFSAVLICFLFRNLLRESVSHGIALDTRFGLSISLPQCPPKRNTKILKTGAGKCIPGEQTCSQLSVYAESS